MGTPLRHSNFYRRAWMPALAKIGLQRMLAAAIGQAARAALGRTGTAAGTEVARSPGQTP